ncbi:hypothetical protein D9757_007546 [Collybiopsis confluens]|uniref:Beta-xylosidase C-terminal Concanavalin A-like domain-containing protein n=1 Tax=Collybiopsis confluens TaxID=2823264 RepID=A0A8H5HET2_9AGAR|nr:hypothetical protein D9757_007546 [Collybiopsis confluens]
MAPWLYLCLLGLCSLNSVFSLKNPILPGWNPDPTILRVGSDYFLAVSSFEYFPGHPIYHSTDLVDWTLIGHALNRPSQLALFGTPSDAGAWGLTLRYHNGIFYLATTVRYVYTYELRQFPRSFFVITTDIFSDNWSEPIYFDSLGYDPDLFWDTTGDVSVLHPKLFHVPHSRVPARFILPGIYQNKIDITTGDSLTPAQLIFNGTLPLNSSSRPEGPHVYFINSTYYLLIAEGGSGPEHRSTIQRAATPSGPWENNPANPILFNGANLSLPVQWTGHSDIVEGPDGRWWGVALGVRPQGDFDHIQLGRETFLFPVTWVDGWPVYNHGQPISTEIPGVLSDKSHLSEFFDDFNSSSSHTAGLGRGLDQASSVSRAARSHWVIETTPLSFYANRQANYEDTFETVLDGFEPMSDLTEAGVTAFYGDFAHNDIGVTGAPAPGQGRVVVTRIIVPAKQVGPWALTTSNNTITTVTYTPLRTKSDPVKLVIVGNSTTYSLGFAEGGDEEVTFTTTFDSVSMSVPPVNDFFFKGAAFGMYNTGNSKPTLAPADFPYWKQTPGGL